MDSREEFRLRLTADIQQGIRAVAGGPAYTPHLMDTEVQDAYSPFATHRALSLLPNEMRGPSSATITQDAQGRTVYTYDEAIQVGGEFTPRDTSRPAPQLGEISAGDTTGVSSPDVNDLARTDFDTEEYDWMGTISAIGSAVAPYASAALAIGAGLMRYKAVKEQAKVQAEHLTAQGEAAYTQSTRQAKAVGVRQRFEEADQLEKARRTGFLSGQEATKEGTGVGAILESNRNAASQLMEDIMSEGTRQRQAFLEAADSTRKAAKKQKLAIGIQTASNLI